MDYSNRIGYIYKLTAPNGKIYIGQTINLESKKAFYRSKKYKVQPKLWNSCCAYDWKPIDTFEIIEEYISGEDKCFLNEREVYWIKFYDSFKNGLNCTDGGGGKVGYSVSEETKEKLRQANLGKKVSKETKEKMRQSQLGNKFGAANKGVKKKNTSNYGKSRIGISLSEDTKNKLRGRKVSAATKKILGDLNSGEKNPHFGSSWINDGVNNKLVKQIELNNLLNEGWKRGRIVNWSK